MDKSQVRKLLAWRQRSTIDYIQLYLNLWIGFNSWFVAESGFERNDRSGIEWVKRQTTLKNLFEEGHLVRKFDVNQIKVFLEQRPMNVDGNNWNGKLGNEKSWAQTVEFLYQVRCNLFHGRKNPDDFNDRKLVEFAYSCLYEIFEYIALEADGVTTYASLMAWKMLDEESDKLDLKYKSEIASGDFDSAKATILEWKDVQDKMKNHLNAHVTTEWIMNG